MRIEGDVDAARVFVFVENFLPGLAAIGRAENAALCVRAIGMPQRRHENDVGIRRIDDDFADRARIPQANVLPGLAAIERLVNAVAVRDVAANAGFARSDVEDVRDSSSHTAMLPIADVPSLIENRGPSHRAVGGLPHSAAGRAEIIGRGIARNSGRGQRASAAKGTDQAILHSLESLFLRFRGSAASESLSVAVAGCVAWLRLWAGFAAFDWRSGLACAIAAVVPTKTQDASARIKRCSERHIACESSDRAHVQFVSRKDVEQLIYVNTAEPLQSAQPPIVPKWGQPPKLPDQATCTGNSRGTAVLREPRKPLQGSEALVALLLRQQHLLRRLQFLPLRLINLRIRQLAATPAYRRSPLDTTSRVNHLLSAGTTYHGACSVAVLRIMSS